MRKAINLIFRFRQLIIFLLLECFCLKINSIYRIHNKAISLLEIGFVNRINSKITNLKNIFFINEINKILLEENKNLRSKLIDCEIALSKELSETYNYNLIKATVVNNSIIYSRNYLTIDKGSKDGIGEGMGVISSSGIVGKINKVSENFSTISSVLHVDLWISAEIEDSGIIGSLRWFGKTPDKAKLECVPNHVKLSVGEKIVTSGYGNSFYRGIPIGRIINIEISPNEAFYNIDLELSTDFTSIKYVYVIKNNKAEEKIELEKKNKNIP